SEYLDSLPADRKAALATVRAVVLANLPQGYEETMQYGMISYVVPHSIYPAGYHCDPRQAVMYAALASQKAHMALYLMGPYGDRATDQWFRKAYAASGKKLDMGKACLRFKNVENLALELIGQIIARTPVDKYIARVESLLPKSKAGKNSSTPKKTKVKGKAKKTR